MNHPEPDIPALLEALPALPPAEQLHALRSAGDPCALTLRIVDEAASRAAREATEAMSLTEFAVRLADRVDAPLARARARRARVRALAYAGRYDEALAAALEAIDIATTSGHRIEAGRASLASMHALNELGRLQESVAVGSRARELFLAEGDPALAGRADINLGIAYLRQDDPQAALDCLSRARPALIDEPLTVAPLDNCRGEALVATNDFAGAERAFRDALEVFERTDSPFAAAIVESNLADLAAREGRLHVALYHFERARRHLEGADAPAQLARVLAEQADAKALLGLPREALREYEEALVELDRCGTALEAARARCGMGLVLLRLERPAEAQTALSAAAIAFDELGHASARAKVDLVRGELALRNGRLSDARRLATTAMASLHDRAAEGALARHLLARVAIESGEDEAAEGDLTAALVEARRLDLAPLLAELLGTRGRLHHRGGDLDEAIADLTEAIRHIERVRGSLQADRFRAAFLGEKASTHEALVGAVLDRADEHAVADAFAVAEQAKGRSLLDQVQTALDLEQRDHGEEHDGEHDGERGVDRADSRADSHPDSHPVRHTDKRALGRLQHELGRTRSELNALYSRIADDRPAARAGAADAWREAVHAREQELSGLEGRLAATSAARWRVARPRTLEEAQRRLAPGEQLLEYFVIDGRIAAFLVEPDGAIVCRGLASIAEVEPRLARLQFQIDRALRPGAISGRRVARLLEEARSELGALHALLLAPLRRRLDGTGRLTIVPHGLLHLVPFQALWDGERYLVERHEIRFAPSASLLVHLAESETSAAPGGPPLVVGVADETAPRIAEEASHVASLLGCGASRVLIGDEATVDRVRRAAPGAAVVHFACHGRFLHDNPFGSGLQMADRWLTVRDICSLPLESTELVTLSGCETGLNLVHAGDELVGLLRSFFAAGAGALIVSQWRVDDESSSAFMARFYDGWNETTPGRVDKAARLRAAQLEILAERPHPAHWAPFILVGRS